MLTPNLPTYLAERADRRARTYTEEVCREWSTVHNDWRSVKPLARPFPEGPILQAFLAFEEFHLTRSHQPDRLNGKMLAALHEAGHFVAFQRVGLMASGAHIHGTPFGRDGWWGGANGYNRPGPFDVACAKKDGLAAVGGEGRFLGEATAALAGPLAEALLGRGDFSCGLHELVGAALWAALTANLTGRNEIDALVETVRKTVALIDVCEFPIRDIADLLVRRKRIWRDERPVKKILARVPRGQIIATQLSRDGQALFEDVTSALAHLEFLGLPIFGDFAEVVS